MTSWIFEHLAKFAFQEKWKKNRRAQIYNLILLYLKLSNKNNFSFQVFENFKPENLTIPEILNRVATYSNLKAEDYKAIQKGIEKVLIKEIKK